MPVFGEGGGNVLECGLAKAAVDALQDAMYGIRYHAGGYPHRLLGRHESLANYRC